MAAYNGWNVVLKVIQINSVWGSGSTGRIVAAIDEAVGARGHEGRVFFGRRGRSSEDGHAVRIGGAWDVGWHAVRSILDDGHGLGSGRITRWLCSELDRLKPDVIGIHNLHGYYLNYELLLAYLAAKKIPTVLTLHDCWPFTGHCSHFVRFRCEKWQRECKECPMTGYYPRSLVDRSTRNFRLKKDLFTGLSALMIVTPSEWLKELVSRSFLARFPVEVIHNGIDLSVFKPSDGLPSENLVLGVANGWNQGKGLEDFMLIRDVLPPEWRIVLIGLTDSQIRKLPRGIEGVRRTSSPAELAGWYSRATVFANPTYADNFPTTNIEALACGTPVVTYATGGCSEAVGEDCGAVVNTGDVGALARKIKEIGEMEPSGIRTRCRERAERRFDAKARYSEYIDLFESRVVPGP